MQKKRGLSYERFSNSLKFSADITLADIMGELVNIYAISDLVFLGGSFVKGVGGHNPLEPAFFNCKIISGKEIFNQYALFKLVKEVYLIENSEIKDFFKNKDNLKKAKIISKADIEPVLKEIKSVV